MQYCRLCYIAQFLLLLTQKLGEKTYIHNLYAILPDKEFERPSATFWSW